MSGRALRVGWVVGGALVLLTGCSLGTHSNATTTAPAPAPPPVGSIEHPRPVTCMDGNVYEGQELTATTLPAKPAGSPTASPRHTPTDTSSDSPSDPSSSRPSGGPSSTSATTHRTPTPSPTDVTVGPLTFSGLLALGSGEQRGHGVQNSGGWHYTVVSLLRAGASATVTVGSTERARAGLEFGGGYDYAPAPAITFRSCPNATTLFRGSFFVAGDGRACVPLDVRVGNEPARHVVISFFKGHCPV